MNTTELINYYADLLIVQYRGRPKAYANIQTLATPVVMPQVTIEQIDFGSLPNGGAVTLLYGSTPIVINWNDSNATIQTSFRAVSGLSLVTVVGEVSDRRLVVTFFGVTPPASILTVSTNSLTAISGSVTVTVTETDVTLPIAVQDAFNVTGSNPAEGVQLDVIGKYAGVSRTGQGFSTQITLNDADYRTLIQIAIIENSAGSSLATIVNLMWQFFPNEVFVIDNTDMTMDYVISSLVGSQDLIQLLITEGRLPRPMAVRIKSIIYGPIINMYFGFCTYAGLNPNATPFNTYEDYQTTWPWITYADVIII